MNCIKKFGPGVFCFLISFTGFVQAEPVISKLSAIEAQSVVKKWTDFDAGALCDVASSSRDYLLKGAEYDGHANHAGLFSRYHVTTQKVAETLAFICQIYQQDLSAGKPSRLQDKAFLAKHFDFYRWQPTLSDVAKFSKGKKLLENLPKEKILLTKYYIKQARGTAAPTANTPHALYAIPFDEQGLSLEQAELQKDKLIRFQLTKQQVLTGILEQEKLAAPVAYLSRTDLEDALMQGTVRVVFDDGQAKTFNVHRNNGHLYDRAIKKEQQKRYWYFKAVESVKGYGKDADYKINIAPKVTVAGDLALWGLGKLVLLNANGNSRIAILADTGGAFEGNGYQLDYLAGYYSGWKDYYNDWKGKPDYYQAYFLILK